MMIYSDSLISEKLLACVVEMDSARSMIRAGFLSREERAALIALARDGSVTHRLARLANALVLLDDGMSCEQVGRVLLLDDDTIPRWHGAFTLVTSRWKSWVHSRRKSTQIIYDCGRYRNFCASQRVHRLLCASYLSANLRSLRARIAAPARLQFSLK
ncbi:MAG: hypothetical protein B7X01_02250 [Acidiphilium sp. 21-62-4]|nr:MAG: hypothetical protein B7X01_02250 [Acidiphilium sp. 21-62-4]